MHAVNDDGNLGVTTPSDDQRHDTFAGKVFTRLPGTLNGKRAWTLNHQQISLYYDEDDFGLHSRWKVNYEFDGASKSMFEQLVDEAEDGAKPN